MSGSGSVRNYRDSGYQQQRGENYNNQQSRRPNDFASGYGNRGRRGAGGNSYRGGTQSDAGTGGKFHIVKISIHVPYTDEASECGDAASSTVSTTRKHRDWSAQVDSEQQQETGYSTDSMIHSATLPRGAGGRGGRRGWKRGRPPLPYREGANINSCFCFDPTLDRMQLDKYVFFQITSACLQCLTKKSLGRKSF